MAAKNRPFRLNIWDPGGWLFAVRKPGKHTFSAGDPLPGSANPIFGRLKSTRHFGCFVRPAAVYMVMLSKVLSRQRCPNGHILGPNNRTIEGKCQVCRTLAERLRRAPDYVPGIANFKKTHCPKGHPYSGDNLQVIVRPGRRPGSKTVTRIYRTCRRAQARNRYWTKIKEKHPRTPGRPRKDSKLQE